MSSLKLCPTELSALVAFIAGNVANGPGGVPPLAQQLLTQAEVQQLQQLLYVTLPQPLDSSGKPVLSF